MGYCYDGWWLNQQFCCWEIDTEGEACDSWHDWSEYTPVRWVIYVIFAVRFVPSTKNDRGGLTSLRLQGIFSYTAARLVRALAKYAAGSGISEIKCILAGFVMKGYLGTWTFVIKSLTLVRDFLALPLDAFRDFTSLWS